MKKIIFGLVLLALPLASVSAAADYYLKIDDIEGESTDSSAGGDPDQPVIIGQVQADPAEGVEPDEIDARNTQPDSTTGDSQSDIITGNDTGAKKGNVETEWKVEEGESMANTGVEPDEIDVAVEEAGGVNVGVGDVNNNELENAGIEPDEIDLANTQTTNFGILFGGGDEDGDNEQAQQTRDQIADVLLQTAKEQAGDTVPMEQISLNFEKIQTKVKQQVKLLGFIPIQTTATVEIDAEENVKVKFPWWAFLAKKDRSIGDRVFEALSNALKHDTVKNAISNIR